MNPDDKARVAYLSGEISNMRDSIRARLLAKGYLGTTIDAIDNMLSPVTGGKRTDIVQAEDAELQIRLWESELNEIMWRIMHEFNQRQLQRDRDRYDADLKTERDRHDAELQHERDRHEKERLDADKIRRADLARAKRHRAEDVAFAKKELDAAQRSADAAQEAADKSDDRAKRANWIAFFAVLVAVAALINDCK